MNLEIDGQREKILLNKKMDPSNVEKSTKKYDLAVLNKFAGGQMTKSIFQFRNSNSFNIMFKKIRKST